MSEQNKKDLHNTIVSGLGSKDTKEVLESINQLRHEGKPEDVLTLIELLVSEPNSEIQSSILKFLADIKDQQADKVLVNAISNKKYLKIRKNLIEICWEASIDFSKFIQFFVDLLIESDFETSFEAFTVIENLTEKIPSEIKQSEMAKLKDAIPNASTQKKGMIHEAIHIIDQL